MFNILSVYLWVPIISPLSAILEMMMRIRSHVISVAPQTHPPCLEDHRQAGPWGARRWAIWGVGFPFLPRPPASSPSLIHFSSGFTCSQASLNQSSLLLFLKLFSVHPTLSLKSCFFFFFFLHLMPCTRCECLLQNLVRMLWGLRFFPNESFPESKYYEGGQIISNYNLQKRRELSQPTEPGSNLQKYLQEK